MPLPDRALPRSRRAGNPELQSRLPATTGPVRLRGEGLERDLHAMAVVSRMLRQGAGRWLKSIAGAP